MRTTESFSSNLRLRRLGDAALKEEKVVQAPVPVSLSAPLVSAREPIFAGFESKQTARLCSSLAVAL
jgi:hypothetical protein